MPKPTSELRPYLSPEFDETTKEQRDAFSAYNELLNSIDPDKIAAALSERALDLSFTPAMGIDETIITTAENVLDATNNGTQIGFGKDHGSADAAWGIIHNDAGHRRAAGHFNSLRFNPDSSLTERENACRKRGYSTLAAVARIHAIANQTEYTAAA